ncbi:hypothetical protein F3Y22_tig00110378pilonHSYRG00037 [Hibiscus syriacus]|uniref:Uncharacterized protein n=1 Tax=Hibiscus syriacus TaxID=106335 RepID=A0A6A3AXX4_HIBSY|nr:hypothetical protein F3Y22_tig00110378pilonHSYRG00037 [Hibiscus syriacus]
MLAQFSSSMAMQRAIQRIHTLSVDVEYANGIKFSLSAEVLRVYIPAADGKILSIGGEKVISGRRHVRIMSDKSVGM